jgi:FdhE protein
MPYAVLPAFDTATCLDLAETRWNAMLGSKPELAAAIALQRALIGQVIDLTTALQRPGRLPRLSLPPKYLTAKLDSGIPALAGEPIQVPVEDIRPTVVGLARSLGEGGGGEATQAILLAIEEQRLDIGALLRLALRREQGALRAFATRAGLGHDLLWLLLDLSVGPFAHGLLDSVFRGAVEGSPLRAALDRWSLGYCPLCGSWPVFAEHHGDIRRQRCSFCAAAWDVASRACIYCGESGERLVAVAPDPARPHRAVETCAACRGYTKVIDIDRSMPFPLLALLDLESMDLDVGAMQRGFGRPALRQFSRR